jgi:tRNA U34 5-methylaminomethyl-2-thiouridine-forming methyltransferase MnmC
MMEKALRLCEDGSHTLYSENVGECYHSIHGAYTESMHIFINLGFRTFVNSEAFKKSSLVPSRVPLFNEEADEKQKALFNREVEAKQKPVRILEVGFGTGLNAFLTALEAKKEMIPVSYMGLEPFPVQQAIFNQLNYSDFMPVNSQQYFTAMHASEWNKIHRLHPYFNFTKLQTGFMEAELQKDDFDLIYFDAFSPEAQPELWRAEVFEKCFEVLANHGILVTYCAKGVVKRTLKSAGFIIENLPGPPGKREITRARKSC